MASTSTYKVDYTVFGGVCIVNIDLALASHVAAAPTTVNMNSQGCRSLATEG